MHSSFEMCIQWRFPSLRRWWTVWPSSVTYCRCSIHSVQDNLLKGDTGAQSHSASVSTVLLDWQRHKHMTSPPASATLKMQHRVWHRLGSSLSWLWLLQHYNNTRVRNVCRHFTHNKELKSVGSYFNVVLKASSTKFNEWKLSIHWSCRQMIFLGLQSSSSPSQGHHKLYCFGDAPIQLSA